VLNSGRFHDGERKSKGGRREGKGDWIHLPIGFLTTIIQVLIPYWTYSSSGIQLNVSVRYSFCQIMMDANAL
jgi:hypothetical protein